LVHTKELILKGRDWIVDEMKKSAAWARRAGFPTGFQMVVHAEDGATAGHLVVNADESEPGTCKDRDILRWDPHKLLEAATHRRVGMGAQAAYIYIRGEFYNEALHVQAGDRRGLCRRAHRQERLRLGLRLRHHPGSWRRRLYLREETALLESLEGRKGSRG